MNTSATKTGNLETRLTQFALDVRAFVRKLPRTLIGTEDGKQLVRASGSVGANYIEACEALSKKDFLMRLKISRKEAREARFWLSMFADVTGPALAERNRLAQEAGELLKILSSIVNRG